MKENVRWEYDIIHWVIYCRCTAAFMNPPAAGMCISNGMAQVHSGSKFSLYIVSVFTVAVPVGKRPPHNQIKMLIYEYIFYRLISIALFMATEKKNETKNTTESMWRWASDKNFHIQSCNEWLIAAWPKTTIFDKLIYFHFKTYYFKSASLHLWISEIKFRNPSFISDGHNIYYEVSCWIYHPIVCPIQTRHHNIPLSAPPNIRCSCLQCANTVRYVQCRMSRMHNAPPHSTQHERLFRQYPVLLCPAQ